MGRKPKTSYELKIINLEKIIIKKITKKIKRPVSDRISRSDLSFLIFIFYTVYLTGCSSIYQYMISILIYINGL